MSTQLLPTFTYPSVNSTQSSPQYEFYQGDFVNVSWTIPQGADISNSMSYNSLLTLWCSGQDNQTWSTEQSKGSVEWLTMGTALWYIAPLNFPPPSTNPAASTCCWSFWIQGWNDDKQLQSGYFSFKSDAATPKLWNSATVKTADTTASSGPGSQSPSCTAPPASMLKDQHRGALIGMGVVIGLLALAVAALGGMLLLGRRKSRAGVALRGSPEIIGASKESDPPSEAHELSNEIKHEMPHSPVYELGASQRKG